MNLFLKNFISIHCLLLLLALHPAGLVYSQDNAPTASALRNSLHIKKIATAITIDGVPDEAEWQQADTATGFWKKYPTDDDPAKHQTVARALYNEQFLYLSFLVHDSGKAFVEGLKRDIGHDNNDGVAVVIDPQNEKTNGFFFVVNAYNVQSEDQLGAQFNKLEFSWNNKWFSQTKRYKDYWTAEIAIPFKTLRFSPERKDWGINFVRIDIKANEYSVWNRVPVNFQTHDLGYTGRLVWDDPPPQPGRNIVFVPYAIASASSNRQAGTPAQLKPNAGFDAKLALNSALNLDLTVNPDFAQVEVDEQVTNLTRYSLFFPEKRNFFLENADLFSEFGIPPIRPFYSRRIGLDRDGNPLPILFGARLTGNLGKTTRIGVMNMQTGKKDHSPAQNYTAATVYQKLWKRSNIKGYLLNNEAFLSTQEKKARPLDAYGRNAGVEFFYSDEPGKWNFWSAYHHSFKEGIQSQNQYISMGGAYNTRKFSSMIDFGTLGTNYYADMGFLERIENYDALRDTVVRMGYKQLFSEMRYNIFPKKGKIVNHIIQMENFVVVDPHYAFNEWNGVLSYMGMFKNTSFLQVQAGRNDVALLFPISFTGSTPLPTGRYLYHEGSVSYHSDFRKPIGFKMELGTGAFYNGTADKVEMVINYRNVPHLNLALKFNYYDLQFPAPYGNTRLFLISPKVDINFSTTLSWTTFLQYNTQGNNFNINSRFQWRYKPMSDLFLVYTDNYFTSPLLKNKNRAVVLKLNYWLNL